MPSQMVSSWDEVGTRVAAARQAAGFTQADLAERVGLPRTGLTRVEQGRRQLDALELVRLAAALGRSVEWFVSTPPPLVASHRRHGDEREEVTRLEDSLEAVARDVELLVEIGEIRASDIDLPVLDEVEDFEQAEAAAGHARSILQLEPGPVLELQQRVEASGLYAFSFDLGPAVIDGGYVRLDGVGAAVINGTVDSGRRRFSLAHELGHHMLADEYSADFAIGEAREDREGLINAFAIHFLLDRASLTSRWPEYLASHRDERSAAVVLAAEYRVSWTAVCNQLRTLGLIEGHHRDQLVAQRPTSVDYIDLGVHFDTELEPVAVPPAYARAVLRAYRHHKIGRDRAFELLRQVVALDELPEPDALPGDVLRGDFSDLGWT